MSCSTALALTVSLTLTISLILTLALALALTRDIIIADTIAVLIHESSASSDQTMSVVCAANITDTVTIRICIDAGSVVTDTIHVCVQKIASAISAFRPSRSCSKRGCYAH